MAYFTYHRNMVHHHYIFLMSRKTTLLIKKLFMHITQTFWCLVIPCSTAHMCKAILNYFLDLSLKLEYWTHPLQKRKTCFLYLLQGNCKQNARCCCQLVFVSEVRLGYVQYFIDFNYCFQFTACYFVIYRITLLYNVSWQVWPCVAKTFPVHHFYVCSYFQFLDGFYWLLLCIVLLCR